MSARIREAVAGDYQQLCKIFREENRYHENLVPEYICVTDHVLTEGELEDFIKSPDKNLIVCEMDSSLLGAVIIRINKEGNGRWLKHRESGYIEELIVSAEFRGKMIGRKLMEKAVSWLKSNGVESLELHVWHVNTRARKFYESIGLQTVQHKMSMPLSG